MRHLMRVHTVCNSSSNILNTSTGSGTHFYKSKGSYGKVLKCQVFKINTAFPIQGPVVQSIVSLTSSLVVKMLTVLVRMISDSQIFLLKKM